MTAPQSISPDSAGLPIKQIVEEADWYARVDANAGLAFHLAKYWTQIRAALIPDAAATQPAHEDGYELRILADMIGSMSGRMSLEDDRTTLIIAATQLRRFAGEAARASEPDAWQARDLKGGIWQHCDYPHSNSDFEYRPLYADAAQPVAAGAPEHPTWTVRKAKNVDDDEYPPGHQFEVLCPDGEWRGCVAVDVDDARDCIQKQWAEDQPVPPPVGVAQTAAQPLSRDERHAVEHARYLAGQASMVKPDCCFDYDLVKDLVRAIDRAYPLPSTVLGGGK